MVKKMHAGILSALTICLVSIPGLCQTASDEGLDPQKVQTQLDALNQEIQNYKNLLEKSRSEHTQIESELQKNEEEMGTLIQKIRQIEEQLREGKDKITQLESDRDELQGQRREQQEHIKAQIRAAYAIGNQQQLKVVLNQEDPAEISRMLTYLDYFNRARATYVNRYNDVLESLRRVESNIVRQSTQLSSDRLKLETQHRQLSITRGKRQIALAFVKQTMQSKEDELKKLVADRAGLESILEKIKEELRDLPSLQDAAPFGKQQGKMLFPVAGKIINMYGNSRNQGKLRWQGVFISAAEGEPIHAIHHGRVVFSDWLRGFGLLLIINHGDGYMSLYGHNQSLYRQAGDWVATNEIISTAGVSGGQEQAGLYFEIRKSGKPTNPTSWCTARA